MRLPSIQFWLNYPLSNLPIGVSAARLEPCSLVSPLVPRCVLLLGLLLMVSSLAWADERAENPYRVELIERADRSTLASEREWHLLLHYRENLFGGYTSEADDPQFFLSSTGRNDPQAELESTIRALFSTDLVGSSKQPAQCAFIARYHWLKSKLRIDDGKLPPLACERFDLWINELNAESITVIFASAFLDNPASMFGHTFLRVDQKGQTDHTRLLAYTINYAAEVPPDEGALYPIKGIFGGFKGYFMTPPYYLKVQEYRDIENRDIWEYRLNFTDAQVRRLLEHAWELGNTYFDYYFFKENCSYHILSLLEYADPTLHLTEQFHVWIVPADTIRLIANDSQIVKEVVFRPSRRTTIRRKWGRLSTPERRMAKEIVSDSSPTSIEEFKALSSKQQAFLLDVASDYLRYQSDANKAQAADYKERNRKVLIERSRLRIPSETMNIPPFADHPDLGHNTSRASMGGGWRNNEIFEELTMRAGYHDLLDPEVGHTPDAQVELASVSLRHYNRASQTRIERATLANVLSLSPIDGLFHSPSWKLNIGMQTIRHNGCQLCSNGVANVGVGAARETQFIKREVYFAFAEAEANYSHAYDERHRIGGGGTLGVLSDLTERWNLMATGTYLKYALGDKSEDLRWFAGSRYTLSQNWALRLEYNHRAHDNDVLFSVQAFF